MHIAAGVVAIGWCYYLYDSYMNPQPLTPEPDVDDVARRVDALSLNGQPQRERSLNLQEERHVVAALDNSIMSAAIESVRADTALLSEQIDAVRTMLQELKVGIHNASINELFDQLQRDQAISLSVVTLFRKDWEAGGELIGTAIKENREVLTSSHRAKILEVARSMSSEQAIRLELQNFSRKLQADVAQGRTVVTSAVAKLYPDLYKLQKLKTLTEDQKVVWQTQFQRLVNQAYINQELRRKQNPHVRSGSFVETKLLQSLNLAEGDEFETRRQKHEAEVEVIKLLLEGEGLEMSSIDELAALMAKRKLEARLLAVGVQKPCLGDYVKVIEILEEGYSSMMRCSMVWKETIVGLPAEIPPKARRLCLLTKAASVEQKMRHEMLNHIRSSSDVLKAPKLLPAHLKALEIPEHIQAQIRDGSLYSKTDRNIIRSSEFYVKWADRLLVEMIQGLDDDDSVLQNGACFGITTRWVCNEQRLPYLDAAEFTRMVGEVGSRDRFRQLQHDFGMVDSTSGIIEKVFPQAFRKVQKIKEINTLFGYECKVKDVVPLMKPQIESVVLSKSHGVIPLLIKGHILYIRIDRNRNIYRLGDVNAGIFDFSKDEKPEDKLYEALGDLLQTFYPDNSFVVGVQFIL